MWVWWLLRLDPPVHPHLDLSIERSIRGLAYLSKRESSVFPFRTAEQSNQDIASPEANFLCVCVVIRQLGFFTTCIMNLSYPSIYVSFNERLR